MQSDSVKRHLSQTPKLVFEFSVQFYFRWGLTREKKISLSLKRHLLPHGDRVKMRAPGFLDSLFDAAPHLECFLQCFELSTQAAFAKATFVTRGGGVVGMGVRGGFVREKKTSLFKDVRVFKESCGWAGAGFSPFKWCSGALGHRSSRRPRRSRRVWSRRWKPLCSSWRSYIIILAYICVCIYIYIYTHLSLSLSLSLSPSLPLSLYLYPSCSPSLSLSLSISLDRSPSSSPSLSPSISLYLSLSLSISRPLSACIDQPAPNWLC